MFWTGRVRKAPGNPSQGKGQLYPDPNPPPPAPTWVPEPHPGKEGKLGGGGKTELLKSRLDSLILESNVENKIVSKAESDQRVMRSAGNFIKECEADQKAHTSPFLIVSYSTPSVQHTGCIYLNHSLYWLLQTSPLPSSFLADFTSQRKR